MIGAYIALNGWQVAIAATLVLVCSAISLALRLGLEWRLFWAAIRTVAQLTLLGMVLDQVFELKFWPLVLSLMFVMTLIAAFSAVGRIEHRYAGMGWNCFLSMWVSAWMMSGIAMLAIVRPQPWFSPQYAIPFLGMILGNTLNGITLGLNSLTRELQDRSQVEALLALGATRWEAARPAIGRAVRTGMIPTINSMMIVGIVSIPGMMTGQLLAGAEPADAVRYQIVIIFLIAAGTAIGSVSVVLLSYRRLFNARHQFLAEELTGNEPP